MCILLDLPRELREKIFDYLITSGGGRGGVYVELAGFAASSKDCAGVVSRYVISRLSFPSASPTGVRFSPLHKASSLGCLPVVHEILSSLGPETVNAKNKFGNTPLHCACAGGQRHVVAHLLDQAHVDVNTRNENGETPLNFMLSLYARKEKPCYRSERDLKATVRSLLGNAAVDVNAPDEDGNTPLHNASTNGREVAWWAVQDLLDRGGDVNAMNDAGKRPHQVAINSGASECVVRMLLDDPRLDKQVLVETIVMLMRPLNHVLETSIWSFEV